jgi:diaminopimelate decarboxylase
MIDAVAADARAFRTPCFVYNPDIVAERHQALRAAVGTPVVVSLKANPNVDLIIRLKKIIDEAGIEVASYRELNIVASRGDAPCYVNNPSLTLRLMQAALGAKARLILDNPDQVEMLVGIGGPRPVAPVLLRANASALIELAPGGPPIRPDQFGMDWETLLRQAERLRDTPVRVAGFHVFAGSNSFRAQAMTTAAAAPKMVALLEERLGYPLALINLGGGFSYRWEEEGIDFAGYREALRVVPANVQILHEAGRAVFTPAGVFVARIVTRKRIGERSYFVCDGGIAQNFLVAGTENRFRKRPVATRLSRAAAVTAAGGLVVGNSCSQDDVIGEIPPGAGDPEVGDLVAFSDCGAYHATYPNQGFLGLDPAEAYLLP